ncbi:hypothetical protein, partial [Sporolactobacillus inulinus]|uniref:hypothetical protein n=1 Tax=Sporolactobacillus inulinus TaxID=2078 RepID=UPI001ED98D15
KDLLKNVALPIVLIDLRQALVQSYKFSYISPPDMYVGNGNLKWLKKLKKNNIFFVGSVHVFLRKLKRLDALTFFP